MLNKQGKIDPDFLEGLISLCTSCGNDVIVGPAIGEDSTVIDLGERCLVAKTDPITHTSREIGYYAVHINANDIAAMGGTPRWFLATILVPVNTRKSLLRRIFSQVATTCQDLGIAYCGGHTEVTSRVTVPMIAGQMLGTVPRDRIKVTSGALAGDDLVMTKQAAIEATALMASSQEKLPLTQEMKARAMEYLFEPGISILPEAGIACSYPEVHALHDPTEGGVATGIFEMARASSLGVEVFADEVPVSEETRILCDHFRIDPLGTFSSGSLLIAVSPCSSKRLIDVLGQKGITACRIGRMTGQDKGLNLIRSGRSYPLPVYHRDELSRIFG